jgi:hypothetical protein
VSNEAGDGLNLDTTDDYGWQSERLGCRFEQKTATEGTASLLVRHDGARPSPVTARKKREERCKSSTRALSQDAFVAWRVSYREWLLLEILPLRGNR